MFQPVLFYRVIKNNLIVPSVDWRTTGQNLENMFQTV